MANLRMAKSEEEVRGMRIGDLRNDYIYIGEKYNKLIDGDLLKCPKCGDILKADTGFYVDKRYVSNRYPICKSCIRNMVEQKKKKGDEPNETKESVQYVLRMMDKVYDDKFYEDCVKGAKDAVREKNRQSPFATYITAVSALIQYKDKTWKDSNFGIDGESTSDIETKIVQKTLKNSIKRFGYGYSDEEYMFLENEYQDWVGRYECNTKAQEEVFENLSLIKLLKKKAIREGKPTKDLDKQQQDWLDTGSLKPRQNINNNVAESQCFGSLIQKYEETRPLPDIDPELEDVDKIGLYVDVFFRGHTNKMLGLKNKFTHIYEKYIKRYTVNKPQYDEDLDSEDIFEKVFGANIEDK